MARKAGSGRLDTITAAVEVLEGRSTRRGLARLLPFLGPAFVASVAYIDPGNFATNIQGGAEFGYLLLWVILASNLTAMLVQALSAKLGIATGRNLAELCRDQFSRPVVWAMWVISELVAMATDLAEFLGAALGFYLLLRIPLLPAALLTGVVTLAILALERRGFRAIEAVITAFVGVVALCYVVETILDRPNWLSVARHAVVPGFAGTESVLLAAGILGATVMPHAVFLHSALTQRRIVPRDGAQARRIFRFEVIDVIIAMGLAGLVNAAMLIMAASTFYARGLTEIASIEEAYRTLTPLLGPASSTVFAVSLLASGLSSSTVGTMAGQVIMQGFLHRQIPIWLRRLVTMAPAIAVIAMGLDPTRTLVISQVILSFGLPFALVPLVRFTSRRVLMGELVNGTGTTVVAGVLVAMIIALNLFLLYRIAAGG
ncbi:MAG: Nramp family divalent metal transporter [Armatimonadota bacterium]|nr:Nramp family divalent metal transporter [Armatimonadota bacterium]MDR7426559.1 Nramp family divalent metal transporter [Armatimonadota bacterium]MDR7465304.1 Nramp family divalent metal transporter [Armatimonadota bacterium]MDR7470831.1 Nramp family divalent metal transporter [Armatimonadota bacterium]MDR7474537.1 Nramp family divalent metal transporter [Armatimonadota bacterium]